MIPIPPTSSEIPRDRAEHDVEGALGGFGLTKQRQRHADLKVGLLVKAHQHMFDRCCHLLDILERPGFDDDLMQLDVLANARAGRTPLIDIAKPCPRDRQWDVSIDLTVGHLHGAGRRFLALDDADDLEKVAADAHVLAQRLLGGQQPARAVLSQHDNACVICLVVVAEDSARQKLAPHKLKPVGRRAHQAQIEDAIAKLALLADQFHRRDVVDIRNRVCQPLVVGVGQAVHAHPRAVALGSGIFGRLN
jgi:hypothetical protein